MKKMVAVFAVVGLLGGCATGLNSAQQAELKSYESKGLAVQEKSPGTGAALGLLPGGGSFYAREYGLGVVNLLFWPLSICWDPVSGYDGAQSINYYATKTHVEKLKSQEMNSLDDQLALKQLSGEDYVSKKRQVENKYSAY